MLVLTSLNYASAEDSTLNADLGDKFSWKVTTFDINDTAAAEMDNTVKKGTTWDFTFPQDIGGLTLLELWDLNATIKIDGEEISHTLNLSSLTDAEGYAFIISFLGWITTDNSAVGTTTIKEGYSLKYDDKGVLDKLAIAEDGNLIEISSNNGFFSFLPISPVFAVLGLFAIPILRRKVNY